MKSLSASAAASSPALKSLRSGCAMSASNAPSKIRRMSMLSLLTMVPSFLSHSTGVEYLPVASLASSYRSRTVAAPLTVSGTRASSHSFAPYPSSFATGASPGFLKCHPQCLSFFAFGRVRRQVGCTTDTPIMSWRPLNLSAVSVPAAHGHPYAMYRWYLPASGSKRDPVSIVLRNAAAVRAKALPTSSRAVRAVVTTRFERRRHAPRETRSHRGGEAHQQHAAQSDRHGDARPENPGGAFPSVY